MYLLHIEADDSFKLVRFTGDDIPAYAILSHRWGADSDEVNYQDMQAGTGRDKIGWQKIVNCGRQAAKDNLEYFWSDTCCIDKSSSAEFSEAINSMWNYYKQSHVCYAYLADVPMNGQTPLESLEKSNWFTRGWTLQELIAPTHVMIHDSTWCPIGTRSELSREISAITGINEKYLRENPDSPHNASIAQRMSWASSRVTKKHEDIAYSLLGLFKVNMPMLYGEGTRAFERLQEEIIRQSDDLSILAWDHENPDDETHTGYLARSPADFRSCGKIVRSSNSGVGRPLVIVNHRMYLEVPLLMRMTQLYARLNCRYEDDFFNDLGMRVASWARLDDLTDRGYRRKGTLRKIPVLGWENAGTYPIAVTAEPIGNPDGYDPSHNAFVFRRLPKGYSVSTVWPADAWKADSHAISTDQSLLRTTTDGNCNHRLVLLDNGHDHHIFIMIWHRKNPVFRDWTSAAAILPTGDAFHMLQPLDHWRTKADTNLPTSLFVDGHHMHLEVTPLLVRGERLTVIDLNMTKILGTYRYRLLWVCKAAGYRLRSISHLFYEPQRFVEPWHNDTYFDQMRMFLWVPLICMPLILASWIEYERYRIVPIPILQGLRYIFGMLVLKRVLEVWLMRQDTWQERGRPDLVVAYSARGNDAFDWDMVCFYIVFVLLPYVVYYIYTSWDVFSPLAAAGLIFRIGSLISVICTVQKLFSEYPEVSERLSI